MEERAIKPSVKLAALFSSFTLLLLGSSILIREMSLSSYAVYYACQVALPGSLFAGLCGFAIGKVAEMADYSRLINDKKNKAKINSQSELEIDDILANDLENLNKED